MVKWLKNPVIILILITAFTILVYAHSISNPFHLDDFHTFVDNPHIRTLANIPAFFVNPDYFSVFGQRHRHYRPVLVSSFALNYSWAGLQPETFRIFNLMIHLVGIWVVYILVHKLLLNKGIALLSAVLFGLHPFQSEVVNYISARSSSLAAVFYLLTVYLFIVFRENQQQGRSIYRTAGLYILFLALFCLALLSKEISLTLPVVLVLADLIMIRLKGMRDFLIKSVAYLPFIVVALFFAFRIELFKFLASVQYASPTAQIQVLFKTPWLLLMPMNLSADHPILSTTSLIHPAVGIPALFLVALLVSGIILGFSKGQTQRGVAFLIFWFFITSLPTTLFPLNQAFVEHRGYLPSVGLIPLMAMALYGMRNYLAQYSKYRLKEAFSLVALLLLTIYAGGVLNRAQVWRDPITLWGDTLAKYPDSKLGQLFLAETYQKRGDQDKAVELFLKIISNDPNCLHHFSCSRAHLNLGTYLEKTGKLDDAILEYEETLRLVPESYWVRYRLGVVYQKQGDLALASQFYQEALKRHPNAHEVHYALGTVYEAQKQYDRAQGEYEAALQRMPDLHPVRVRLASVLVRKGFLEQARLEYETVLAKEPQNGSAHRGLGYIHEIHGYLDQAIQHYEQAMAAGSDDPGFRFHLGSLYLKAGNRELTKKHWENALAQAPDFLEARLNLAQLLRQEGRREEAIGQYRKLKAMVPEGKQFLALRKQVDAELRILEKDVHR